MPSDTSGERASLVLNSKLQETGVQNTIVLTRTHRFFLVPFPRLFPLVPVVFCCCWGSGGGSPSLAWPALARVRGGMSESRGSCYQLQVMIVRVEKGILGVVDLAKFYFRRG